MQLCRWDPYGCIGCAYGAASIGWHVHVHWMVHALDGTTTCSAVLQEWEDRGTGLGECTLSISGHLDNLVCSSEFPAWRGTCTEQKIEGR